MKFRLYCGIFKNGEWFNYCEIKPLKGGSLALLEGHNKSGAARLLNLVKGSVSKFLTEDDKELEPEESDILNLKVIDTWKIGYEQIKIATDSEHPVIAENFFCPRCSRPESEHYTFVEESWEKLIEEGLIDEVFLKNPDPTFDVTLPIPVEIEASKTIVGGTFDCVKMEPISLGDMIKIHKNVEAMSSEANMIYTTWDAMIVKIPAITDKDLNILKRVSGQSFSRRYLQDRENIEAIEDAESENMLGIGAKDRKVSCRYCHEEIGGYLDLSNFFSPLLQKKSSRSRQREIPG